MVIRGAPARRSSFGGCFGGGGFGGFGFDPADFGFGGPEPRQAPLLVSIITLRNSSEFFS